MNKATVNGIIFVSGGLAVGGGVGYILAKRKYLQIAEEEIAQVKRVYKAQTEEEIENVKDTYKLLRKEPPYDDPATALKAYNERLDGLNYRSEEDQEETDHSIEVETDAPVVINIFDTPQEIDVTTEDRSPEKPYLITEDEFFTDREEFDKITVTYFEEDATLVDDREQTIPDMANIIGNEAIHRFGHGSNSEDTVYVRNEQMSSDFEVCRETGSYSRDVLGITDWNSKDVREPKPKVQKMRNGD